MVYAFKAERKNLRRAAVNALGYLAKALGPVDIVRNLLGNFHIYDRQIRVCSSIAIGIVAESCFPFTVIPVLCEAYQDINFSMQNGILKSFAFTFEFIGEMSRDYLYSVVTLLESALIERHSVHRQSALFVISHLATAVFGLSCEDGLVHLLNFVWPNVFEHSRHIQQAFIYSFEGFRVSLGARIMFLYVAQGMFHAARGVKNIYWRLYRLLFVGSHNALCESRCEYDTVFKDQIERKQ